MLQHCDRLRRSPRLATGLRRLFGPGLMLVALGAGAAHAAPAAAQSLFQENCAPCHGLHGEGGIGPQLAGRGWAADAFDNQVRHGGLVMPAFPAARIPDAELQELLAYVNGLATPPAAALLPAPAAKTPGAASFAASCQACHGAEARGGLGPGILNTSLAWPDFLRQVRHGGGIMPPFATAQLGDAKVRQIYDYLHPPLARPDPGTIFPLPTVPDYAGDFFLLLALLAVLAQVGSERRCRIRRRVELEEEALRARIAETAEDRVRVRAF